MSFSPSWRSAVGITLGVAALTVLAAPLPAQGTGTVRGRVTEAVGARAVEAVQVFIPNTDFGTLSNAQGQFELVLPAGAHTVSVRRVGYRSASQQVNIEAGQITEVTFALQQAVIQLDQIVVTGAGAETEKRRLGNTIASIDVTTLQIAPTRSLSELIAAREPSVVLNANSGLAGEGSSIRIRGSASLSQSNEPIVYVDGIRVDRGGGFNSSFAFIGGGGAPSRIDDINPDAIERVEVLKGAAAATLYGTEASNGVIQIFTKRGYRGTPKFDFSVEQGWATIDADRYKPNAGFARYETIADCIAVDPVNRTDDLCVTRIGVAEELRTFYGRTDIQPFQVFEHNFIAPLLQTGYSATYSGSVSGGTSAVTYFLNARYQQDNGPFSVDRLGITQDFTLAEDLNRRMQGTAAVEVFPADNLKLRATTSYTDVHHEVPQNNNNIYGVLSIAIGSKPERASCRSAAGNSTPNGDATCTGLGGRNGNTFATIREAATVSDGQDTRHYMGSVQATYNPVRDLTLDLTVGVDQSTVFSYEFFPFGWNIDGSAVFDPQGIRSISERNRREITVDGKARWERSFGENWSSTLIGGAQGFITRTVISEGLGAGFPGPGLEVTGAAANPLTNEIFREVVNAGVFGQEQLGYRDFAFVTVGGRWDRNSAFGEAAGTVFYPKASVSFIPSALSGWSASDLRAKWASTLRLRAAVGKSGLQPDAFAKFTTFSALSSELGPGLAPENLGNQQLKPEVSTQWEVGFEWAMLQDRLAFDVTYWDRVTKDALFARQFAPSGGFRNEQIVNIGQLDGKGLELAVRALVVNRPSASLELWANTSFLEEIVTDLGGAPALKVGGSYIRYRNFLEEGYAPGSFFGPKLVPTQPGFYPVDTDGDDAPDSQAELLAYLANPVAGGFGEAAIRPLIVDEDGDGDFLDHFLGKATPDWQGSFGLRLGFARNFRLSSTFEYKVGDFSMHNLTDAFRSGHPNIGRNFRKAAEAEATLMNPASTADDRLAAWNVFATELGFNAPLEGLNVIQKSDFLRWRELSLSYDVPAAWAQQRLGLRNMSITAGVRNLALWTGYPGIDPESNFLGRGGDPGNGGDTTLDDNFGQQIDAWGLALPRRFTLRVNFGF